MEAENPYFTEKRARMTFAQLLTEVEKEYEQVATFAEGLSGDSSTGRRIFSCLKTHPWGNIRRWRACSGGSVRFMFNFTSTTARDPAGSECTGPVKKSAGQ